MGCEESQLEKMKPVANKDVPPVEMKIEEHQKEKTEETAVENKSMTTEEYVASAPPQIQELLSDSLQTHEQKKQGLIDVILANEKNTFTKEQLFDMKVNALSSIAALAQKETGTKTQTQGVDFSGMAPVGNASGHEEEPLEEISLNFDSEK